VTGPLQVFLPPGYLADVYDVMRQAGVVCVADEVGVNPPVCGLLSCALNRQANTHA